MLNGKEEYQYWLNTCPKNTREEFPDELVADIKRQLKSERTSRLYELEEEKAEIKRMILFMDDIGKFVFTKFFLEPIEKEKKYLLGWFKFSDNKPSKVNLDDIKQIPITRVIAYLGINANKPIGKRMFFKLRQERTPSACAFLDNNHWYDFGSSKGGSVIDLVMEYNNLSFRESLEFLSKIAS